MSAFGGKADITATERNFNLRLPQKLRQLGDIDRNASRLIAREWLGRRSSSRLILEIDIGERLSVVVAHDKACGLFLDGPRRRGSGGAASRRRLPLALFPKQSQARMGERHRSQGLRGRQTRGVTSTSSDVGATYGRAIADAGEPAFCKVSHCSKANSTAAQNSCSL